MGLPFHEVMDALGVGAVPEGRELSHAILSTEDGTRYSLLDIIVALCLHAYQTRQGSQELDKP